MNAKSATTTTDLTTVKEGELLAPPAAVDDALLAGMAGEGNEQVRPEDVAIPRLVLLQSTSPQIKRTEAAYIEGAQEGMYLNTLTQELYGEQVTIINCHFTAHELEWTPRTKGGGLRGVHNLDDPLVKTAVEDPQRRGRFVLPNGNDLVHTQEHYVLVQSATGAWSQALLALNGTQLKHGRRMNGLLSGIYLKDAYGNVLKNARGEALTRPRFATVLTLRTKAERNDQGSWFVIDPHVERVVTADELALAKGFRDAIAQGGVKVEYEDPAVPATEVGTGPTIDGTVTKPGGNEIPF